MITKLKKPCWVALCDNCKEDLLGNEYIRHYKTKKELMEHIAGDIIIINNKNQFCCEDCVSNFTAKKEVDR